MASSTSALAGLPSAMQSLSTRKPASSHLPDPNPSASKFTSAPRTRDPARSGSSAPSLRWAAKTQSSSAPMPTSTLPLMEWSLQPSASAGKSVPPVPAPSLKHPSTMPLSSACASASPRYPGRSCGQSQHGSVINQAALDSMLKFIEVGKKEGRLIAGGNAPATTDAGYFLEPTVFADIAPDAALAQEELFGPVLAVIKVANFEEGLRVANNTEYGLTESQSRPKLPLPPPPRAPSLFLQWHKRPLPAGSSGLPARLAILDLRPRELQAPVQLIPGTAR